MLTFSQAFNIVRTRVNKTIGGRTSRSEYWYFFLISFLVLFITGSILRVLGFIPGVASIAESVLTPIISVFTAISLGLGIRRLHDQNRSGWLILLALVPLVGGLILLVFFCLKGTVGPNRFGEDPLTSPDAYADIGQPNYNIFNEQAKAAKNGATADQGEQKAEAQEQAEPQQISNNDQEQK